MTPITLFNLCLLQRLSCSSLDNHGMNLRTLHPESALTTQITTAIVTWYIVKNQICTPLPKLGGKWYSPCSYNFQTNRAPIFGRKKSLWRNQEWRSEYCWRTRPGHLRPPDWFLGFSSETATAMWGILIAAWLHGVDPRIAAMVRVFPAIKLGSLKVCRTSPDLWFALVHSSFGKVSCVLFWLEMVQQQMIYHGETLKNLHGTEPKI